MKFRVAISVVLLALCACKTTDGIRYDDTIGVPSGYKDLCKREPAAPECAGEAE